FGLQEKQAARQRIGLPSDRPIIIYVGNLKASKGALDLVEAARQMATASKGSGSDRETGRRGDGATESSGNRSVSASPHRPVAPSPRRPLIVVDGGGPAQG